MDAAAEDLTISIPPTLNDTSRDFPVRVQKKLVKLNTQIKARKRASNRKPNAWVPCGPTRTLERIDVAIAVARIPSHR
jgi:hypothetical protein